MLKAIPTHPTADTPTVYRPEDKRGLWYLYDKTIVPEDRRRFCV